MADRDTTKRMFTHMINMMEQHDTMTISCGDPLMELLKDVRELLKEQEAQKFFVDESGNITPLPVVVRCKDCKHRPTQTEPPKTYGFSIEFPEGSKCPCQCSDGWYSWYPEDDWFCANGERREGNGQADGDTD